MKNQKGVSLIEVLLVMVIAAGILYYSTRQYLSYRRDADVYQLRYNVDLIFQAMTEYFRANCGKAGHPLNSVYPGQVLTVTLTQLQNGGFFTSKLAANPLVQQTTAQDGYLMQFNQISPPPRQIAVYSNPPQTPVIPKLVTIGNILLWQAQVAVNLKDASTAKQYQQLLQATCLSIAAGGEIVTPCLAGPSLAGAQYAVWERLPSFSSSVVNSTYWTTLPVVKQFTQMYTTYSILLLTSGVSSVNQYFVCGT